MNNLVIVRPETLRECSFSFTEYKKLIIRLNDRIRIVSFDNIEFIEGDSNYSIIHMIDGSKVVASKTLKTISMSLDNTFIRCHKSFIANLKYIQQYEFKSNQLTMNSSKKIQVSRANKSLVKEVFRI